MNFLLRCLVAWLALGGGAAYAEKPIVLTGQVVGPDGRPVAGAHVLGTLEWDRQQTTFAVATVSADGTFEHRLTRSESPLRSIRVFAYAAGYSNAEELRTPPWGTPGAQRVTIRLRPAISLTVQVVDPSAAPVPTAMVTISQDSFSTAHPLKGIPQRANAAGAVTFSPHLGDGRVRACHRRGQALAPQVSLRRAQRFHRHHAALMWTCPGHVPVHVSLSQYFRSGGRSFSCSRSASSLSSGAGAVLATWNYQYT